MYEGDDPAELGAFAVACSIVAGGVLAGAVKLTGRGSASFTFGFTSTLLGTMALGELFRPEIKSQLNSWRLKAKQLAHAIDTFDIP